jgi:hypothetical protein
MMHFSVKMTRWLHLVVITQEFPTEDLGRMIFGAGCRALATGSLAVDRLTRDSPRLRVV